MVSKLMNFMYVCRLLHLNASTPTSHLVHVSDADHGEALLTQWGPDGLGELGSAHALSFHTFVRCKVLQRWTLCPRNHS